MGIASGTFEVKLSPLPLAHESEGAPLGRMSIDKTFSGDVEGTSVGEMLSGAGTVKGSAGYVAIELVTGTIAGRKGSFILQHTGTMNRGVPQLAISVVPDSGTGELADLSGTMTIGVVDRQHRYTFEYRLPDLG